MDEKSAQYGVSAQSYLRRAYERLREQTPKSLFYAALELRCCVEARQAEYLEHLKPYQGQKLRPYRLGESRKKIAAISGGKLIAKLTFNLPGAPAQEEFHTPVPAKLVAYCERHIDSLRHAQPRYRPANEEWWNATRQALIENYRLAWVACQGMLMTPPLWTPGNRDTHPMVFNVSPSNELFIEAMNNSVGGAFRVKIDYLEQPPAEWVCDL